MPRVLIRNPASLSRGEGLLGRAYTAIIKSIEHVKSLHISIVGAHISVESAQRRPCVDVVESSARNASQATVATLNRITP